MSKRVARLHEKARACLPPGNRGGVVVIKVERNGEVYHLHHETIYRCVGDVLTNDFRVDPRWAGLSVLVGILEGKRPEAPPEIENAQRGTRPSGL